MELKVWYINVTISNGKTQILVFNIYIILNLLIMKIYIFSNYL